MKSAFSTRNKHLNIIRRSLKKNLKKILKFFLITRQEESFAQDNDAAFVESLFISDSQADPLL